MSEGDFLFPALRTTRLLEAAVPILHDMVQKLLDEALAGAKITGKFSMHCFRRSSAQFQFMSAPLGKRWSLRCVRFWGGWAEGEQVCAGS